MCGIAGFINFERPDELARRADDLQQHRGPDNQGHWIHKNVCLSHQRLSIIDLDSRSNQPFIKEGLVIVFNGEIYNYRELKTTIANLSPGTSFRTQGDTEVVLELYRLKKEKCLDDLIGMFAFALYEIETGKLFVARDHFGIKPLFYTQIRNRFAFSSELKTIAGLRGFDRTINMDALVGSLNYLWVPGSITMFRNTFKLPAAHFMVIDTLDERPQPVLTEYWRLQPSPTPVRDEEQAVSELREILEASVKRHMVADVPVSSFLSGGIDSSLISVMAAPHTQKLSTYTIATSREDKKAEQMPEDERYAKKLAAISGFDHHEMLIHSDIVSGLEKMVVSLDEPIGDPAALNTYLICRAAHERGVKVLLSGMGADEIFFGYRRQKATLMSMRYRELPSPLRQAIGRSVNILPVRIGSRGARLFRWSKRFLSFAELDTEQAYMMSYSYYDGLELQNLCDADISGSYHWLRDQHRGYFNAYYPDDVINQMCFTDIHMFMQGLNLTYTDRASMAASVEVRVPFIDRQVVESAMNIHGSLKYRKNQSKYILRQAATPYLPKEIIFRPKASFGAPIRSWISKDLRSLVDELLSSESVGRRGILHHAYVRKLIDDDRDGRADNAYRIYQLLTLELWFRHYVDL